MTPLHSALSDRFTDPSEIDDVAQHGCSGGVSGFIYHTEINEFFNLYETEIEETLAYHYIKPGDMVNDSESWSFDEIRQYAVWFAVELHCQQAQEDLANNNNN